MAASDHRSTTPTYLHVYEKWRNYICRKLSFIEQDEFISPCLLRGETLLYINIWVLNNPILCCKIMFFNIIDIYYLSTNNITILNYTNKEILNRLCRYKRNTLNTKTIHFQKLDSYASWCIRISDMFTYQQYKHKVCVYSKSSFIYWHTRNEKK